MNLLCILKTAIRAKNGNHDFNIPPVKLVRYKRLNVKAGEIEDQIHEEFDFHCQPIPLVTGQWVIPLYREGSN